MFKVLIGDVFEKFLMGFSYSEYKVKNLSKTAKCRQVTDPNDLVNYL